MPTYEYRCVKCNDITETFRRVDDRNDAPVCEHCGGETRKIISLSFKTHGDFEPYYDDNLETHITSKAHRRRVMKEQGVEENFGQGWHTSSKKIRSVG